MKLNIGSGYRKKGGYINIDIRPETEPDMVCDLTEGLPFADNSIDEIRAWDILEHIPIGKVIPLMNEIWRVLKPEGKLKAFVPSTDGRGAHQDPTHVSFWNINSWNYYMNAKYKDLYGVKATFKGRVWDEVSDPTARIIHTYTDLVAVK